jgi:membrane carboxypeptidase/penicillin-binding protein
VAVDPSNGYIKAMVGGRDYSESQFNRTIARRQPGSAFKPFIYAAALDKGFTTIHQLMCKPIKYPKGDGTYWIPRDYNNDYHYRPISLREALVISDNVVSVQWLKKLGIKTVINFAKRAGIKSPLNPDLTLALGSSEVTPLEIAAAYCVFANGGYRIEPIAVLKVVDPQGRVVMSNTPTKKKVLNERVTYILTDILKGVLRPGGTGAHLKIYGPAVGKTGTTQHNRDAWFVGYTPFVSVAVYVGYDNPKRSLWSVGGVVAGPIWRDFINKTFEIYPQKDFEQPDGIIVREICSETKKIANPTCPKTKEIFIPATEPKQKCPLLHWDDLLDEHKNAREEQSKNDDGNNTHEDNNDKVKNKKESSEDSQQTPQDGNPTENWSNRPDFAKGLQEILNSKEKAGN